MTAPDAMPTGNDGRHPQVLLAHHLKQLKLPTVLRQYDKVARGMRRVMVWMTSAICCG